MRGILTLVYRLLFNLNSMPTKVTVRDIAKQLNVSHTTVSRVLSGAGIESISEATRGRVIETAHLMGYRPNLAARALATGRTNTIMLWNGILFTPYAAAVLRHVKSAVSRDGYVLTIWDMGLVGYNSSSGSYLFPQVPADGILALEMPEMVEQYRMEPAAHRLPLVSFGGRNSRLGDNVGVDLTTGAAEALRHLIDLGCRRIAYLATDISVTPGDARYETYRTALMLAGLKPELILTTGTTRSEALAVLTSHVTRCGHPDGLLCYNDEMAIGANRALREMGVNVPNDVALIGCDGIEECEYQYPSLSTIALPLEEMCETAWSVLKARLLDPAAPTRQVALPTHLVVRGSSTRS